MTASALIEKAAVRAGLAESGNVSDAVLASGLDALNRWYRHAWMKSHCPDVHVDAESVSVVAGATLVNIPTVIDRVLCVYDGYGALSYRLTSPGTVDGNPVSRIIIRAPVSDVTIYVDGLRRCTELAAVDEIGLSQFEGALHFYVLADFLDGDDVAKKAAFATAENLLLSALSLENVGDDDQATSTPSDSMVNG